MSSSMTSNSNGCGRPNLSSEQNSQIPQKSPESNDIGWNYENLISDYTMI